MFCSTVLIAALAATQGASASGTRQLQISLGSTLHTFDSDVANGLSTIGPKALGIKSPPLDVAAGVQHAFHHDNYVPINLPHFGRKLQDGGIPLSVNGGDGTTSLGDEIMGLLPHMEKIPPQGLDMRPLYELEHEAPAFEDEPYPRTGVDFAAGPQDINIAQGAGETTVDDDTTIDDVIAAPDNATNATDATADAADATDDADAADADTINISAEDADAAVLGLDSDQVKYGRRKLQISLGSTLHSFDSDVAQGLSTIGPKALGIKSPPLDVAAGVQHAFHHDNYVPINLPHFGK